MKKYLFMIIFLVFILVSCNPTTTVKYKVNFDVDGEVSTKEYSSGESVEFPTVSKEGYDFIGWQLNGVIVDNYIVTDKDLDFVALFDKVSNLNDVIEHLDSIIPLQTNQDIELPTEYKGVEIKWTTSRPSTISKTGVVTVTEEDVKVTLQASLTEGEETIKKSYEVTVLKISDKELLNNIINNYEFDAELADYRVILKSNFSTKVNTITAKWESSNPELLNNYGILVTFPSVDTIVTLTLTLKLRQELVTKNYQVEVKARPLADLYEEAINSAKINTTVNTYQVDLPTEFAFNIVGEWFSNDESILTNEGVVRVFNEAKTVKMTLKYWIDGETEMKEKEFEFNVFVQTGTKVVRATDFASDGMNNVELSEGKLVLKAGQTYGEYVSGAVETFEYKSLVGSWAAVTSTTATVQFYVSVRVNNVWSDYIAYSNSGWGLGLQNAASDKTNSLAKLSTDEVKILNSKVADAVKFKLVLRRNTVTSESPKVSLVAFALEGSTYKGLNYSLDDLPKQVKYDVPKLYQQVVPGIGNSICSATSSTMLLKYKGLSFTEYDSEYEHRYMASIVRDYGNAIYGNWVYNTVAMSGYGFDSYVARLYSANELAHHLANVGPVAISVKGQMTSSLKDYYTGGHLLCIIGYTIENGVITFIANDPNVKEVECTYSLSVINNTWRNIIYVIE